MTMRERPEQQPDDADLAETRAMLARARPEQLQRLLSDIRGSLPAMTHPRERTGFDA